MVFNNAEYRRKWHRKLRDEVINHYGGCCACCNENNVLFLCIDHVEGNGNAHRRLHGGTVQFSGKHFYYWLKRNQFPDGFQVLCFNCNNGKQRNNGICPHLINSLVK